MNEEFSQDEKNGFYKAVFSRRDVRSHFIPKPIDDKTLSKILNAAHHAPSVGFSQPWNFILIKDVETRKKVKESFDNERKRSATLVEDPKRTKYLSLRLEGILSSLDPRQELQSVFFHYQTIFLLSFWSQHLLSE